MISYNLLKNRTRTGLYLGLVGLVLLAGTAIAGDDDWRDTKKSFWKGLRDYSRAVESGLIPSKNPRQRAAASAAKDMARDNLRAIEREEDREALREAAEANKSEINITITPNQESASQGSGSRTADIPPKNVFMNSEGKYFPAPGYAWLNDDQADLRVVRKSSGSQSATQQSSTQQSSATQHPSTQQPPQRQRQPTATGRNIINERFYLKDSRDLAERTYILHDVLNKFYGNNNTNQVLKYCDKVLDSSEEASTYISAVRKRQDLTRVEDQYLSSHLLAVVATKTSARVMKDSIRKKDKKTANLRVGSCLEAQRQSLKYVNQYKSKIQNYIPE